MTGLTSRSLQKISGDAGRALISIRSWTFRAITMTHQASFGCVILPVSIRTIAKACCWGCWLEIIICIAFRTLWVGRTRTDWASWMTRSTRRHYVIISWVASGTLIIGSTRTNWACRVAADAYVICVVLPVSRWACVKAGCWGWLQKITWAASFTIKLVRPWTFRASGMTWLARTYPTYQASRPHASSSLTATRTPMRLIISTVKNNCIYVRDFNQAKANPTVIIRKCDLIACHTCCCNPFSDYSGSCSDCYINSISSKNDCRTIFILQKTGVNIKIERASSRNHHNVIHIWEVIDCR